MFKFGEEPNIEKFRRLGQLFMRPLHEELRTLEADELRGDKNEGICWAIQPDQAKLQAEIDGVFQDIPGIVGPIRYSRDQDQKVNVFWMYALRQTNPQALIDPRNFSFGDTYAFLKDGDEFLRRLRRTVMPNRQQLRWGLVKYVDPTVYSGSMGVFSKFSDSDTRANFELR